MSTLSRRLELLEQTTDPDRAKPLPEVASDDAPDSEIERLRKRGREVLRYSDFLEHCL